MAIAGLRQLAGSTQLYWTLVERNLRLRAKRSWMGLVFPSLVPFLLAALYVYLFGRVFDVPIPRYSEYIIAGLLPWSFFMQSLTRGMASVSTEAEVISKARFPHALLPLSSVTGQLVNLAGGVVLFIAYLGIRGDLDLVVVPALVPAFVALALFTMAVAMLLALVDVYNQDARHALPHVLTVWFFVIPIVYRPRMAPERVRDVLAVEPIHHVVSHFRDVLYLGQSPHVGEMAGLLAGGAIAFVAALTIFQRCSTHLAEDV